MVADFSSFAALASLWVLAAYSVAIPALIVAKTVQLARASAANRQYALLFRAESDWQSASAIPYERSGRGRIANVGSGVLRHVRTDDAHVIRERLERNLRRQLQSERRVLESGLRMLANLGKSAPFVGLFGAVWAIIAAVPGGQALAASVVGIAAAIVALLAFNCFTRWVSSETGILDDFIDEFLHRALREPEAAEKMGDVEPVRPRLVVIGAGPAP